MGFAPLVSEKLAQVQNHSTKNFWKLVRFQFGWPRVLMFLAVTLCFYTIMQLNFEAGIISLMAAWFVCLVAEVYSYVKFTRVIRRTGKKFLSLNYFSAFQGGWSIIYIFTQIVVRTSQDREPVHAFILSVASGLVLVLFVAAHRLLKEFKQQLVRDFPEVFTPVAG